MTHMGNLSSKKLNAKKMRKKKQINKPDSKCTSKIDKETEADTVKNSPLNYYNN